MNLASSARVRQPLVAGWLFIVAGLVAAMILVGGATRLTDSGLSITEWRPFSGALPPMNEADWAREFALYQTTTEFQEQNYAMTLAEFELIYWWEWGHRFLGRFIGVVFAVPFVLFWTQRRLTGLFWPTLGLGALGGLQGAVGWWMVASGLVGRLDVSPIRLAIHLGLAFIIFGCAIALALAFLRWPRGAPNERSSGGRLIGAFMALLFVQILLGALVAGSDAGRAYTDWPTIGGALFPPDYSALSPFWRNLVENHAALQFNHRTLGYIVGAFALLIGVQAMRARERWRRVLGLHVLALALLQTGLGIATIMLGAPLWISLIHQGGAIALFGAGAALFWGSSVRYNNTAS